MLLVNEAVVFVEKKSAILPDIDVYYQQEECDQCSLLKAISLNSSQQAQFIVDTTSRIKFVVQNGNDIICSVPFKWLDEQGSYSLSTNLKGNQTCQFENVRPGPYGLAPLIVVILVHLFIAAGWMLMRKIIFKTKSLKSTTFSKRIRSLDAFRGCVCKWLINHAASTSLASQCHSPHLSLLSFLESQ